MSKQTTNETLVAADKVVVEAHGPPNRVVLRVIIVFLTVVALLWVISKITGILFLLVLSIFFAYLVSPLVEFLRQPRTIGTRTIAIPRVAAPWADRPGCFAPTPDPEAEPPR